MAYRQLSLPRLLTLFGRARENLLVIGRHNCWLVNCRTFHARHFVGTRLAAGVTTLANSEVAWRGLVKFVKRYAAPNATVKVHCLHEQVSLSDCVAVVRKRKGAAFQLPGCSLANKNGIKLPGWIRMPLGSQDLGESTLIDFSQAKAGIQRALRPNRDVPGVGVEMTDEPTVELHSEDEEMCEDQDEDCGESEVEEDEGGSSAD